MTAEEVWRRKADEEVLDAIGHLEDYTDEGRTIILSEAERRKLNVAPLLNAITRLRHGPADEAPRNRCAYCDTRIFFGGRRQGAMQFCDAACESKGVLLSASHQMPEVKVKDALRRVHQGACPLCGGAGPIDVHTSYTARSLVFATWWASHVATCCRRCATRASVRNSASTLLLGWWAIPWGPVATLGQVGRNLYGLWRRPDEQRPSAQLERIVRLQLAEEVISPPVPR